MKHLRRTRESIISIFVVIGCVAIVVAVTIYTNQLVANQSEPVEELVQESVAAVTEDSTVEIDAADLFVYKGTSVAEKEKLEELIYKLPFSKYLIEYAVEKDTQPYRISLTYCDSVRELGLTMLKKDQIMAVNSSLLMSLCSNVDIVTVDINVGTQNTNYHRMLYKPDLDSFFNKDLRSIKTISAFKKFADFFIETEQVTSFFSKDYTYASALGEDIDLFYKTNFPIIELNGGSSPTYIDEDLGEDLIKIYGYQLFIEGLKYDNDIINYYSAYRLSEFCDSSNLEEILIELATCRSRTESEAVKLACSFTLDILKGVSKEDNVQIFTRFTDSDAQGGKKAYVATKGRIYELATWAGISNCIFKDFIISPEKNYVWCLLEDEKEQIYGYTLALDGSRSFELREKEVSRNGVSVSSEWMSYMKESVENDEVVTIDRIEAFYGTWELDSLLRLDLIGEIEGESESFNGLLDMNSQEFTWIDTEEFKTEDLLSRLKSLGEIRLQTQNYSNKYFAEATTYTFGEVGKGDRFMVYEYNSPFDRGMQSYLLTLEWKENKEATTSKTTEHFYEKGNLLVEYSGNNQKVINLLERALEKME